MQAEFWQQKWRSGQIGFHQSVVHPALGRYWSTLELEQGSCVFVPLCGKSLDLWWLRDQGHEVVGVELVEEAVTALFAEAGVQAEVRQCGPLRCYQAQKIRVYVGDFFQLNCAQLGPIAAVYDRAALVALPKEMRQAYAEHLLALGAGAPQLIISFDYEQRLMQGPPFAVSAEEIGELYGKGYQLELLQKEPLLGGFKERVPATESIYWLRQDR